MVTVNRLGFIRLLADKFKEDCLPYPKKVIEVIDSYLPPMAIRRNEKLQETMRVSSNKFKRKHFKN
jgi:hypothetical protein